MLAERFRFESVEDIDFDRVVVDRDYRRQVIDFLNGLERAAARTQRQRRGGGSGHPFERRGGLNVGAG